MLISTEKQKIIKKYGLHGTDTGSPEIQVALFTEEIKGLLSHLKKHPKDLHSKLGLLKQVSKRKKLLNYLKRYPKRYSAIIKKVGLKK